MLTQMSGKMMGRSPSGETVTYVKGAKMRTDQTMGGNELSTIMELARRELASYMKPKSVDFIDELPKGPTGKILKRDLRAPYWEGRDREV